MGYQGKLILEEDIVLIKKSACFLSIDDINDEKLKKKLKALRIVYGPGPFDIDGFFKDSVSGFWYVVMRDKDKHIILAESEILRDAA